VKCKRMNRNLKVAIDLSHTACAGIKYTQLVKDLYAAKIIQNDRMLGINGNK